MKVIKNPVAEEELQMFFEADKDIKKVANTEAIVLKDTSLVKKLAVKHNTNSVWIDAITPEPTNLLSNGGFETNLDGWTAA